MPDGYQQYIEIRNTKRMQSRDEYTVCFFCHLTKRRECRHPRPHPTWDQSPGDATYHADTTDGIVDRPWDTVRLGIA